MRDQIIKIIKADSNNAEAAADKILALKPAPAPAIDLNQPKIDGVPPLEWIRQYHNRTRAVVTGNKEADYAYMSLLFDQVGFLLKQVAELERKYREELSKRLICEVVEEAKPARVEGPCKCGQRTIPGFADRVNWYWQVHGRDVCTLELPNMKCWCGLLRSEHVNGHAEGVDPPTGAKSRTERRTSERRTQHLFLKRTNRRKDERRKS